MQICITGANGFIGRKLVERLSKEGHSINILTRKSNAAFPDNVKVFIGDLTKTDCQLDDFINGCEILFHCAGEIRDVSQMHQLHIDGTERLIKSALNYCLHNKKNIHWIQLSSCGAYGSPRSNIQEERLITEATPCHPANEYEITKTKSDTMLIEACRDSRLSYSILRPSNVIGSSMIDQRLRKLINTVKGGYFFYLGKPGAIATYIHVSDVVDALWTLAVNPMAKGEIYNLSDDCTYEDLITRISSQLNIPNPTLRFPAQLIRFPLGIISTLLARWIHIPKLDALVLRTRYSTTKIELELGFSISMRMPNAIDDIVNEFV